MDIDEDDEGPSPRRPNFFDLEGTGLASDDDILLSEYKRKAKGPKPSGPVPDAVPISLDEGVETIGEAFMADMDRKAAEQMIGPCDKKSTPIGKEDVERLQKELKALKLEIEKVAEAKRWEPPNIPDTINRLLTGKQCCLEWFKTLEEKQALMYAAAATYDGNCIIAVLIYLRRTLSLDVLLKLITRDPVNQPILMGHYCVHLRHLGAWNDIQVIHSIMGNHKSYASFQLKRIEAIPTIQEKRKELQLLQSGSKTLESDAIFIQEYIQLLDRQLDIQNLDQNVISESKKLPFQPLSTTLLYLCQWHGHEKEDRVTSPVRLKADFNISEKVLFQMRLMAECKRRDWAKFDQLLTSKGFFGTKQLKSAIGFERVVRILGYYGAPQEVIHPYLMEIEDPEARLDLARHYKCHNTAIETLKLMKDRHGLEDYINYIDIREQGNYRDKIQGLLANSQIKWK